MNNNQDYNDLAVDLYDEETLTDTEFDIVNKSFSLFQKQRLLRLIFPTDFCEKLTPKQIPYLFAKHFDKIVSVASSIDSIKSMIESDAIANYQFWRDPNSDYEEFLTSEEIVSAYACFPSSSILYLTLKSFSNKLPK